MPIHFWLILFRLYMNTLIVETMIYKILIAIGILIVLVIVSAIIYSVLMVIADKNKNKLKD